MMRGRTKAWAALLLLTVLLGGGLLWRAQREPPLAVNAILITIDTLRPDRMSLYGYQQNTTPQLGQFFAGSAFTNARSTAPCTLPAVKQFLTGRLDMGGATLAQTLQGEGFETAAVVSQHWFVSDPLYRSGFDYWDPQADGERDHYGLSTRRGDAVTARALRWLDSDRDKDRRFFLWVHYFDPHDPYDPPMDERHFSLGIDRYIHGDRRAAQIRSMESEAKWFMVDWIFDDADRDALSRLYDDEVRFVDRQVGDLLDELENRGLLESTAIVFGADHGERLGEEGVWDHCYSLHDLELRVPLAIRMPGPAKPLELDSAVSTLDFYPTLLDALDVPEPGSLDGESLLRPIKRGATLSSFNAQVAVADGNLKLYLDCTEAGCAPGSLVRPGGLSVFDERPVTAASAPGEVDRLAAEARELDSQLSRAIELAKREFEALHSLGYIQ
jgi:arylsulfatase A-like enzyme